jgi:hypothetical protein
MERVDPRPSVVMGFPASTHRWSAASGVAFVIFSGLGLAILGTNAPTYDDTPATFARFYASKASTIELSALLGIFAAASFVWFAGFLRWTFGVAEGMARGYERATSIAYAGSIAGAAVAVIYDLTHEAAVVAQGTVPPGVIRMLDLMGAYAITAAALLFSVFLLASFFLVRVTGVLPQWLALLAMLGTVLGVVQAVLLVAPQDDNGVFGALAYAWFFVFAIWVAGASLTLVRRVT